MVASQSHNYSREWSEKGAFCLQRETFDSIGAICSEFTNEPVRVEIQFSNEGSLKVENFTADFDHPSLKLYKINSILFRSFNYVKGVSDNISVNIKLDYFNDCVVSCCASGDMGRVNSAFVRLFGEVNLIKCDYNWVYGRFASLSMLFISIFIVAIIHNDFSLDYKKFLISLFGETKYDFLLNYILLSIFVLFVHNVMKTIRRLMFPVFNVNIGVGSKKIEMMAAVRNVFFITVVLGAVMGVGSNYLFSKLTSNQDINGK